MPSRSSIHVVDPLIVRRVVKRHRPVGFQIPHDQSYVLPTADLLAIVESSEIEGTFGEQYVALVAADEDERTVARRRFHAEVHLAVRRRLDAEPDEAVHERIDSLGRTEFDAVRAVLLEEDLLVPPYTDASVWEEFVAQFLELQLFAPTSLTGFFPTLRDLGPASELVHAEVDVQEILARTGAPTPEPIPPAPAPFKLAPRWARSQTEMLTFATLADDAERRNNHVRAALLRRRASLDPHSALLALGRRLFTALPEGPDAETWTAALEPLLDPAASDTSPVEARLLLDLQHLVEASERENFELDPVGWALSGFGGSVLRPLPGQRLVQGLRHLRTARGRMPAVRIHAVDAAALARVLGAAEACATELGRAYFAPRIEDVVASELPPPANLPERVAQQTLIQRLVDRLLGRGFLTIGDLRDALSGSPRKLPDLTPRDFIRGDALLRIDRRLTRELDGAYRRGEIYMRVLLRLSAVFFGTRPGRFVTLFGTIPFGGAYLILSGLQHIVAPPVHWLHGPELTFLSDEGTVALGVYLLLMIHWRGARSASLWVLRAVRLCLVAVLWTGPHRVYQSAPVQAAVTSRPGRAFVRYVAKPAIPAVVFGGTAWATLTSTPGLIAAIAIFVAFNLILNSRLGRHVEDRVTVFFVVQLRFWRHHLVPGLIELVLAWSRRLLDAMERVFYRVDEWLRYRSSDTRASMVGKAALGLIWGAFAYVVRIYVNLLIEPQINPIKHFPVVTVSHKIILPFTVQLTTLLALPLRPLLGPVLASTIVGPTVVLLPGVFGFLVWELKENWRLYEANRPKALHPVVIGHHGETMLRLMKPGFHSGTLPRLFRQLRDAVAKSNERKMRKRRDGLREVHHALDTFLAREFVALLAASGQVGAVSVKEIVLGSNRVQIALRHAESTKVMQLDFEEHGGWLLVRLTPGWLADLPEKAAAVVHLALDGVYRACGVDILADDVEELLPPGASYDVVDLGLAVWPAGRWETEGLYDLKARGAVAPQNVRGDCELPIIDATRLLVRHRKMTWVEWVARWAALSDHGSGSTEVSAR